MGEQNKTADEIALVRSVLRGYPTSFARGDALRALTNIEAALAAPKVEPAQQATKGAHPIFAFLDGSAPFEGVWFGERHPTRKGGFWWRSVLREALAAQQAPAQPAGADRVTPAMFDQLREGYELALKSGRTMAQIREVLAAPAKVEADARRWDFVRRHWSNAQLHWNNDPSNSLKSLVLTIKAAHEAASMEEVEKEIDAAIEKESK